MKSSEKLEVVQKKLGEITPYANNPRNNDDAVEAVAASIKEFGFQQPIVTDKEGVIIVGHTRLKAAEMLGLETVPVVVADLDEDKANAYRLADNKTGEIATWDFELLDLELEGIEMDMEQFGFEIEEAEPIEITEDDFTEDVEARCKLGDLWQLGEHRLICGDSTDASVIDRLMGGQKADMVFTDPPYGVDYEGINNDTRKGLRELLADAFNIAKQRSKNGASVYCFHSDKCADIFHEVFRTFCHFSSMIIWKKESLVLSQGDYQSIHEPCLYGWFNNGTHLFYGDRKQTSVWEFERKTVHGHTTPKPIGFICKALINSSKNGNIIFDMFGGSGSTLIACEQLNRKCFMCELDPHYCDVIINRWEQLTGEKAELITS